MFLYSPEIRKRAIKLRKNMTPWERKLWYMFLKNYSVSFKRQVLIHNYIADLSCYSLKLIIELDGSGHYMPEQEQYDKRRTILLQQEGYMVLRFSNYDIDKNFYGVCSEIDKIVKERMRSQV